MQHGLADYEQTVRDAAARWRGTPTVPIVRVPWNEQGIIGRVLDAGAMGVIIPMVNSARRSASAPSTPAGTHRRALAASARSAPGMRYGGGYFGAANDAVACIPMIETRGAVETLDDIFDVPGIDAVYVGPADLSVTYGLPPGLDQPGDPFQSALATIVAGCERHGVVAGHPRAAPRSPALRHGRLPHDHGGLRRRRRSMQALRADEKAARAATT